MTNNLKKTSKDIAYDIMELLQGDSGLLIEVIEDLDSYNGYLGDDRYYDMELLTDFYADCDPSELLNRAYYGYDADSWHTDSHGEKQYGAFNPNRDYFRFNGYGNLVSAYHKDYSDKIDRWLIDELSENVNNLCSIEKDDELYEMLIEYNDAKMEENSNDAL